MPRFPHSSKAPALAIGISFALRLAAQAATSPTPEQAEFFERKIRPVLVTECYECHSGKKTKGGLRLDWRGAVEKGGDNGPAVVPGNPAKSLLIQSIRHEDQDLKMPKNSAKLDDDVIADFVAWVNMGAPDPRENPPAELPPGASTWDATLAIRKGWWSFQPVHQEPVPAPKGAAWSDHPVDRFLLAKMEAHGLPPAADAEPRAFIRRLTFALTGLPPKPEEIDAFVAEAARDKEGAIRKLTDRLLESPRFGECWARHWMDLMRYAETHGSEGDPEIREAWRYRDYLIRAFNSDVPWDQLIREHLAGDLLPNPRWNRAEAFNESMLGTASLRLNEHGFQPVDTLDDQVKTIDNQIDVISKAFQGLTVSCARCHDHKFDAIGQRDFYALYGVLASSRPAQVIIDAPEKLDAARAKLSALKSKIRASLADVWLAAAQNLPTQLMQGGSADPKIEDLRNHLADAESRLREIENAARATVLKQRGANVALAKNLPQPIAEWQFQNDGRDSIGSLHGELLGGAVVRDGRLVLNGADAAFRTPPLPVALREKTLEAWATPSNLEQRGGGVITVETLNGATFDSIVFAEKDARRWMVGSNLFRRTQPLNGPDEAGDAGQLVHLAAVFRADNSIALYRNGAAYGQPYTPKGDSGSLQNFEAGGARILMGRRHSGGQHAFFAGEIADARLYDRALSEAEVAASYSAGPGGVSPEDLVRVMEPTQRESFWAIRKEIQSMREQITASTTEDPWKKALQEAGKDDASPLAAWVHLHDQSDTAIGEKWSVLAERWSDRLSAAREKNKDGYSPKWDLTSKDAADWFHTGQLPEIPAANGEFSIEPGGKRIVSGIYPAGIYSHLLSQKFGGLFTSPRFKIETDNITVRALGGEGAMVRLIVDNYPLGVNPIFPKANLESDKPAWVRLDTAYRKGSWAYLEFGTYEDLTRPVVPKAGVAPSAGRSYFGVSKIVFQNRPQPPEEEDRRAELIYSGSAPANVRALADKYAAQLSDAIVAWKAQRISEPQRALLDDFVRAGLLPVDLDALPALQPLVEEYRKIESDIPKLRHAPGVIEARGFDAPLMPRGDYTKPGELVPRGFLKAIDPEPFHTVQSGRLELANDIADARNPLTARVMVNRIWEHLFGRGIVPTVDNFGRLGEKPTHPELLDYLASRFVSEGWSCKQMIRFLVTSRAYRMSSEPSAAAKESDPGNNYLSHFRIRRLEAESIRDSLLSVSGQLSDGMYGPSLEIDDRAHRSVYLAVRRTRLSPFLEIFDAPKPFSTLGRRDATNVPAQSLAFLNDPFVIKLAGDWAANTLAALPSAPADQRVNLMFAQAFGRPPRAEELQSIAHYLEARGRELADTPAPEQRLWQDLAQSLFNLKEFLYIR